MLNRQGRPTQGTVSAHEPHATFTGNRALQQIEPLIFEIGHPETTGVDIDAPAPFKSRLGAHARQGEIGLPGLSEPETMR
ncbi:MAG: glycine dehydrogenase (aminomethyl-transferring), partial [Methylobacterium sp.]|nr:glycine dehydrogenase (aminomethyl-transferring) [Methylobacterium sp.]